MTKTSKAEFIKVAKPKLKNLSQIAGMLRSYGSAFAVTGNKDMGLELSRLAQEIIEDTESLQDSINSIT